MPPSLAMLSHYSASLLTHGGHMDPHKQQHQNSTAADVPHGHPFQNNKKIVEAQIVKKYIIIVMYKVECMQDTKNNAY